MPYAVLLQPPNAVHSKPFGPFKTAGEASAWADEFRGSNEISPEEEESLWYIGVHELSTAVPVSGSW